MFTIAASDCGCYVFTQKSVGVKMFAIYSLVVVDDEYSRFIIY